MGFFQSLLCGCQPDDSQQAPEKLKNDGVLEEYYDDGQLNENFVNFNSIEKKNILGIISTFIVNSSQY